MAIEKKYGKIEVPGIPEDEPIFILRAQDVFAGFILDQYANMRYSCGDVIGSAAVNTVAGSFRNWPTKKIPD